MEEYLDIVDENDKVLGKDTRENIHKNHQIHRGVHVLVINSEGKILVQVRSHLKKDRPLYLDASVGAQVESGETYEEAAKRETKEELGFSPKELIKIADYKSYSDRQKENRRLFITYYEGPFKLDVKEVESVKFLSTAEIKAKIQNQELITQGFIISFENYLQYLGR